MRIGIIGAGHLGGTLARNLASAGHLILLANAHGPDSLKAAFATEKNITPVHVRDAVKDVSMVVISIPEKNVPELPKDLFAGIRDGVIIVDTGNYYPVFRDPRIDAIERGMPESQWVAEQIGRPVIKAFNSIFYVSLRDNGRAFGAPDRIALPVAGDNTHDKDTVRLLMNDIGFDGLDAGSLADSWRQQPGTPAYCTDLTLAELPAALARADRAEAPRLRDLSMDKLQQMRVLAADKPLQHDMVDVMRAIFRFDKG